ncbi:hypothetical protein BGZ73_005103 [Actinomortierella ambigua]|nr:hypothetical protein BGZ73_005103 [Actinomortierella ambigua]
MSKTNLYRFTHNKVEALDFSGQDDAVLPHPPPSVSLPALCGFSAILFMTEFDRMGAQNIDVAQTCNMSEWQRRLFAGKSHAEHTQDAQGEPIDIASLPAKHPARSGLIYATTTTSDDSNSNNNESFSAFLFVIHKRSLSKPPAAVAKAAGMADLSAESQQKVDDLGVTHIWLCGSAPEQRRQHLMSKLLAKLEHDVVAWKAQGLASGVISVHTIPQHFPGMVQFLRRQGFQGGLGYEGGDGKVVYWKEV